MEFADDAFRTSPLRTPSEPGHDPNARRQVGGSTLPRHAVRRTWTKPSSAEGPERVRPAFQPRTPEIRRRTVTTDTPIRYSPESATAALALIRPIVRDIRTAFLSLQGHLAELGHEGQLSTMVAGDDLPIEARDELASFGELLAELAALGVRLEDPEIGRIAFSGMREGQEVSFCWKIGEDQVRYWYREDSDYDQRLPI